MNFVSVRVRRFKVPCGTSTGSGGAPSATAGEAVLLLRVFFLCLSSVASSLLCCSSFSFRRYPFGEHLFGPGPSPLGPLFPFAPLPGCRLDLEIVPSSPAASRHSPQPRLAFPPASRKSPHPRLPFPGRLGQRLLGLRRYRSCICRRRLETRRHRGFLCLRLASRIKWVSFGMAFAAGGFRFGMAFALPLTAHPGIGFASAFARAAISAFLS